MDIWMKKSPAEINDFSMDFAERHEQIPDYIDKIKPVYHKAIIEVVKGAEKMYLDGIRLIDIIDCQLLNELGYYRGYGFCYEAAALGMFILKNNPTARLVIGTAVYDHRLGKRCDHAWVEFEVGNEHFVFDQTWFPDDYCIPRIVHVDVSKSIVLFTCSFDQFWEYETSQNFYKLCHVRKTSYILPWLWAYRTSKKDFSFSSMKTAEKVHRSKYRPTGKRGHFDYFNNLVCEGAGQYITPPEDLLCITT